MQSNDTIDKFTVVYEKEYPYFSPSTLKFKSLIELIRFINFYLLGTNSLIKDMMIDEIREHKPLDSIDLNWLLNCYGLCYDNTHIYCGDDVFTFNHQNTFKLFYMHLIKVFNRKLIKINKTIKSVRFSFDYADNRLDKIKLSSLKKLKQIIDTPEFHDQIGKFGPSYTSMFIDKCSSKKHQVILAKDFPMYLNKYNTIVEKFSAPSNKNSDLKYSKIKSSVILPDFSAFVASLNISSPIKTPILPHLPCLPEDEIPLDKYSEIEKFLLSN